MECFGNRAWLCQESSSLTLNEHIENHEIPHSVRNDSLHSVV